VWLVVGVVAVALVESPKFHAYDVMVPYATLDADASNDVAEPAGPGATVNDATGAWSGVMATLSGPMPTAMFAPAVLVATLIGVTVPGTVFAL
jgi:hypothetical protein